MTTTHASSCSGITLIVAMDLDRVIGLDNDLPWHIPVDLQFFKQRTVGKPMIMGRGAYTAIGRALPGRTSIVMSRHPAFRAPGCLVAHDVEQAIALAGRSAEVMVIGGADIYTAFLPLAQRLDVTLVRTRVRGDTWFPPIDDKEWHIVSEQAVEAGQHAPYPLSFREYRRISARSTGNGEIQTAPAR